MSTAFIIYLFETVVTSKAVQETSPKAFEALNKYLDEYLTEE